MVNCYQYLGIELDSHLKFNKHVDYLKRKLYVKMKSLGRIKQFISNDLALDLYRSLILPHIDYGDMIYDAMSDTLANQVQVIQNNCLRICLGRDSRSSTKALHDDAELVRLSARRKQHVTQQVYKGLSEQSTPLINNMYIKVSEMHTLCTRSSANELLAVPSVSMELCRGNIKYRGAIYYNKLPPELK